LKYFSLSNIPSHFLLCLDYSTCTLYIKLTVVSTWKELF